VTESDVYTSRAGNLVHLRSDFSYNAGSNQSALIDALFPTPAVCGMPKEETREFILDNETIDREYYSGFAGLLNVDGSSQLFVTLRCMKLLAKNRVRLFAGGGIMPDSVEADEWHETENKMETIKTCIATKKM
jgi:isochorismate synthase